MAKTVRINGFVSEQAAQALDELGKKLFPGMPRTDGLVLNKALLDLAERELGWTEWRINLRTGDISLGGEAKEKTNP